MASDKQPVRTYRYDFVVMLGVFVGLAGVVAFGFVGTGMSESSTFWDVMYTSDGLLAYSLIILGVLIATLGARLDD